MTLYLPVTFITYSASGFFVSFAYRDLVYVLAAFTVGIYVAIHEKLRLDAAGGARPAPPVHAAPAHPLRSAQPLRFPPSPPGSSV